MTNQPPEATPMEIAARERRFARVAIGAADALWCMRGKQQISTIVLGDTVLDDFAVRNVYVDPMRDAIGLVVVAPELAPVPSGAELPPATVTFEGT